MLFISCWIYRYQRTYVTTLIIIRSNSAESNLCYRQFLILSNALQVNLSILIFFLHFIFGTFELLPFPHSFFLSLYLSLLQQNCSFSFIFMFILNINNNNNYVPSLFSIFSYRLKISSDKRNSKIPIILYQRCYHRKFRLLPKSSNLHFIENTFGKFSFV